MFTKAASPEDAVRISIDALRDIVLLYDRLGLMFPAAYAATALHAANSVLESGIGADGKPATGSNPTKAE